MASASAATGGGIATGAGTRVDVTLKLSQLQNLCKRDPAGYREDYDAQIRRLESECGILALSPLNTPSHSLVELIQFAAAVSSSSYKGVEANRIAQLLMDLLLGKINTNASGGQQPAQQETSATSVSVVNITSLSTWALQLHRDIRKACVSALILMRNKGSVNPLQLLSLFFRIMSVVPDKALREQLYKHMVNDIRNINAKGKRDDKTNRQIQSFLHKIVSTHGSASGGQEEDSATDIAAKLATNMVCELYRKQVWTCHKTVGIVTSAVLSKNTTVMARAIRFFLGIEEQMAFDLKQKEEDEWLGANSIDYHLHSKKTQGRLRHVQRQLKNRKKHQKRREGMDGGENTNWNEIVQEDKGVEHAQKLYPAIELIHDPQGLAESVFQRLRGAGKTYKYEIKLIMMNFITRLVGNHELILLQLYPFLQKYMGGGHQRDVTAVLAYTVQACHPGVPPEEIHGILKTIAHNFITERCSEEQMAVGINAARAICARVPTVMSSATADANDGGDGGGSTSSGIIMDMEAFARDLAGFGDHRDRSVSIAGKGWQNFVREINPTLLQGKHRGLKGSALHKAGVKVRQYGEDAVSAGVAGADLLVEYESKKAAYLRRKQKQQKEEGGAAAGVDGTSKDDEEDGWVEVEEEDSDDDEAPDLIKLDPPTTKPTTADTKESDDNKEQEDKKKPAGTEDDDDDDEEDVIDLSKMTPEERAKLRMEVSATRVFTPADFEKMRKLVEREQRAKRDPREAARRKRALARGDGFFESLSGDDSDGGGDDDSDEEDDDNIRVTGMVNPMDIMATATRKRQSKAERLAKVVAGREKFESTARMGGSTNTEKKRKKNFTMSKFSREARTKGKGKTMLANKKTGKSGNMNHESRKRRRKF